MLIQGLNGRLLRQEQIDKDESRFYPARVLYESSFCSDCILGGRGQDMIYKEMSSIGKRIEAGTTCECSKLRHREYDRLSRDKSHKLYRASNWQRMRECIMNKYDNLDVYAYVLCRTD